MNATVDGAYYQNIIGKATLDMGFNQICFQQNITAEADTNIDDVN
ncbi:hypothetical protein N9X12_09155 [Alphaproteobacteria bacterium]|nr:hypothetical protein [Alphaproteobacteria bacterium]